MNRIVWLVFIILIANLNTFGQVTTICDNRYTIKYNNSSYQLPFSSNHSLITKDYLIKRAVIFMHGADRNAVERFNSLMNAAKDYNINFDTVLIITPQFLIERDLIKHDLDTNILFWTNKWNGWKYGYNNQSTSQFSVKCSISSFSIMDSLLNYVIGQCPSLENIVLAGHSAGGQYTLRYAASNQTENVFSDINFRYLPMNAGTYLYMDEYRRIEDFENKFEIPTNCENYDRYKFGLSSLNNCEYIIHVGANRIIDQFQDRTVCIMVGEKDNNPNANGINNSDCREYLQGVHRVQRATIYFNHLLYHYGTSITNNHNLDVVPQAGHSTHQMVNSSIGKFRLFTWSGKYSTTNSLNLSTNKPINVYPNPTDNTLFLAVPFEQYIGKKAEILDINGNQINIIDLTSNTIELSDLDHGTYFLKIGSNCIKFIKI